MDYITLLDQIESLSLDKLNNILQADDIELLNKEYFIENFGALLGSTKGLTKTDFINLIENGSDKLSQLLELVPPILLKKYRNFNETYPMGALKEQGEDNEDTAK